jgi:hypothetical protein
MTCRMPAVAFVITLLVTVAAVVPAVAQPQRQTQPTALRTAAKIAWIRRSQKGRGCPSPKQHRVHHRSLSCSSWDAEAREFAQRSGRVVIRVSSS